jgi:anti-sigma factor RsiW
MSKRDCERIQEVLPEWILGSLKPGLGSEVKRHLASCPDCTRDEETLRQVLASRPTPPPDLPGRIQARVREEMASAGSAMTKERDVIPLIRRPRWAPTWALSAAAVVILSLGIGVLWNGEEAPEVGIDSVQAAAEEPLPEQWLWDDGMVAGAPVYDGLTDEQLEALIEELER